MSIQHNTGNPRNCWQLKRRQNQSKNAKAQWYDSKKPTKKHESLDAKAHKDDNFSKLLSA